jgi:hypothetical protein
MNMSYNEYMDFLDPSTMMGLYRELGWKTVVTVLLEKCLFN